MSVGVSQVSVIIATSMYCSARKFCNSRFLCFTVCSVP